MTIFEAQLQRYQEQQKLALQQTHLLSISQELKPSNPVILVPFILFHFFNLLFYLQNIIYSVPTSRLCITN